MTSIIYLTCTVGDKYYPGILRNANFYTFLFKTSNHPLYSEGHEIRFSKILKNKVFEIFLCNQKGVLKDLF